MTDDSRRHRRQDDEEARTSARRCSPTRPTTTTTPPTGCRSATSDTGPLPHWTEPPTGEMPRTLTATPSTDPTDDLDVWSSFAGKAPGVARRSAGRPARRDGRDGARDRRSSRVVGEMDDVTNRDDSIPLRREPGRITIGTDPTDDRSRPVPRKGRPGEPTRGGRPARSGSSGPPADACPPRPAPRDLPTAIAVGAADRRSVRGRRAGQPEARPAGRRRRPRLRRHRVLRQGHREGLPAGHHRRHHRLRRPRRSPPTGSGERALPLILVLGFVAVCRHVHRRAEPRAAPDAEHGHHHARHHVDRVLRLVRGADPAVLEGRRASRSPTGSSAPASAPTRCASWPSAWSPTTSARSCSAALPARRRCGPGSAPTRASRA